MRRTQGICTFSPALDKYNNTIRGLEFAQRLVNRFSFHTYDIITGGTRAALGGSVDKGVSFTWAGSRSLGDWAFGGTGAAPAGKLDPRLYLGENRVRLLTNLCYAASIGDCYEIQRIVAQGIDVNSVRQRRRRGLPSTTGRGG